MGVAAAGSVLARHQVAQGRVSVPVVVIGFEVTDHDAGFEQAGPMVAVEAFVA